MGFSRYRQTPPGRGGCMPGWTRWLLAPVHALALTSGAKSFEANPLLGSQALNRRGLHLARKRLALRLGARRRARLAGQFSPAGRAGFDPGGHLVLPDFPPAGQVAPPPAQIPRPRAQTPGIAHRPPPTPLLPP